MKPPSWFYVLTTLIFMATSSERIAAEEPLAVATSEPAPSPTATPEIVEVPDAALPSAPPLLIGVGLETSGEDRKIELRVRAIHAHASGKPFVDPALDDIRRLLLSPKSSRYDDFRQVADETFAVGVGDRARLDVVSISMDVTVDGFENGSVVLLLDVLEREARRMETTIRIGSHKLFFVAGPRLDDGFLIFAVEPWFS